jgi:glycerophosphoryl diester phosphodiesterase
MYQLYSSRLLLSSIFLACTIAARAQSPNARAQSPNASMQPPNASMQPPLPGAQMPNPLPAAKHHFIVVCHRGDHENAPENTLAGYANAIKAGADYVEIDLRTTVDSQLVIMHDASVNRMTSDTGQIKNMTWETLRQLKVKDKNHPEWGEHDIPLFSQVLDLCKDKIYIYLDFKNADPAAAYREIARRGMEKQVLVYINAPRQFTLWRSAAPAMPLMVSLPGSVKNADSLVAFLNKYHPDVLDGNFDEYTTEMIKAAAAAGCMVLPDIQRPGENAALWDSAIQKGLKGLQTDHPEELIPYLKERQIR